MTKTDRKLLHVKMIRWSIPETRSVSIFKEFFRLIWNKVVVCSLGKPCGYRRLPQIMSRPSSPSTILEAAVGAPMENHQDQELTSTTDDSDSDLVKLKITILGDRQIGKTSFAIKYVGDEQEKRTFEVKGLKMMDKTLSVRGARITFNIWDVEGDMSLDQLPIACKDAVAIFFMFDLTCRSTLHSVIYWYSQARKWNQNAIPILIGTKFDDFVQLPPDIQETIITQARTYARAMKATLFFSSVTHNINVNKVFKFIIAKLFNLSWTVERNIEIGEPVIDF